MSADWPAVHRLRGDTDATCIAALKLLGFMPRGQVKPQHTHKHSYLIYPNETVSLRCLRVSVTE